MELTQIISGIIISYGKNSFGTHWFWRSLQVPGQINDNYRGTTICDKLMNK